jgi:hypothetical protein
MIDAVGSLLNNAVDLYVQAVDYCRILTSQISTPVGAGIRQRLADVAGFRGYHSRFRPDWLERPDLAVLAESPARWLETGQDGRLLVNWLGSGRFVPDSDKIAGIRQKWSDSDNFCRNMYMPNIKKKKLY